MLALSCAPLPPATEPAPRAPAPVQEAKPVPPTVTVQPSPYEPLVIPPADAPAASPAPAAPAPVGTAPDTAPAAPPVVVPGKPFVAVLLPLESPDFRGAAEAFRAGFDAA